NAWRMIADTAVTSGAFPAAFSPRVIARHRNEYGKNWNPSLGNKELFAYVDGGLFNNEPLRMAIDMARKMDGRNSGDAKRIFIVIDPTISADKHAGSPRFFVEDDVAISGPPGAIDVLKTVAGAVQGEATAKDWMKASRKNHELEWFEKSTKNLAEVVTALPSEFESKELTKTLRNQVDDVIRTKFHATVGRPLDDAQQVKRYRETQASLLEKRHEGTTDGMSAKQKELFIAFVAMLENAAGLRKKEKLRLLGIAPEVDHPPAGRFLESFGGFFDNSIRAHDYQLGRSAADRVLQVSSFCDFVPDATAAPPAKLERGYDDLSGITKQLFESYTGRFVLKALKAPENWATKAAAKVIARFAVRWAGRRPEDLS
ncbi:MAG TPA: hypothetical protein VLA12_11170, partial [Planctomycetaceae bacterium]|nr:hypothetical protein [Planctomycetaceae bacterium]